MELRKADIRRLLKRFYKLEWRNRWYEEESGRVDMMCKLGISPCRSGYIPHLQPKTTNKSTQIKDKHDWDCESNQQLRLEFTQITKTQPIHALFDITWETDVLDLVVKTIGTGSYDDPLRSAYGQWPIHINLGTYTGTVFAEYKATSLVALEAVLTMHKITLAALAALTVVAAVNAGFASPKTGFKVPGLDEIRGSLNPDRFQAALSDAVNKARHNSIDSLASAAKTTVRKTSPTASTAAALRSIQRAPTFSKKSSHEKVVTKTFAKLRNALQPSSIFKSKAEAQKMRSLHNLYNSEKQSAAS
eukprot:2458898-Rhodomonas_salina.1